MFSHSLEIFSRVGSLALSLLVMGCGISSVFAQNEPLTPQLTPGRPAGSYGTGVDNVNLFNGNLNIQVPLIEVGGRGSTRVPIFAKFETKWNVNVTPVPYSDDFEDPVITEETSALGIPSLMGGGIRLHETLESYIPQECDCSGNSSGCPKQSITTLTFVAPDGNQYKLVDKQSRGAPITWNMCPRTTASASRGTEWVSVNGEAITFIADSAIVDSQPPDVGTLPTGPVYGLYGFAGISGNVYFPDGTKYRVSSGFVQWAKDKDGNTVSFTYTTGGLLQTITDSLGRVVTFAYAVTEASPYGLCNTITFKGTGGELRVIRLSFKRLEDSLRTTRPGDLSEPQEYDELFSINRTQLSGVFNPWVTSEIWLPDGRSYKFKYNTHREVSRVEFPTGGAYEFDHAVVYHPYSFYNDYRRVTEKRVYDETDALLGRTEFSTSQTSTGVSVVHKDAAGSVLSRTGHYFYGTPVSTYEWSIPFRAHGNWVNGKEYKSEVWNTSGTQVMQRTEKSWAQPGAHTPWASYIFPPTDALPNNPRVVEEKITLPETNLVSKKVLTYDDSVPFGNIQDVYEYDWGSGASGSFLRRSHTDYISSSSYIDASSSHLRRLPSAIWTSSDSVGTAIVSRTDFEYDEYASNSTHAPLGSRSSVIGHDTTNYGTGHVYRGNITAVTSYENAAAQTGAVTVFSQYDILGNIVKSIDANGNPTTVSYSDNFGEPDSEATSNTAPSQLGVLSTFAFPTLTTNPLSWVAHKQYDYFTGAPVNSQDVNGLISKTIYDDDLDRPTQTVTAIGSSSEIQASVVYDDANRRVETTSDIFALNDNLSRSEGIYDGLGRTVESRSYSDGDYVSVKNEYDALGRTKRVSNPFRPTRSETPVWTETTYDSLGRVIEIAMPNGELSTVAYDGNRTLAIDQAGKKRLSKANAIAQLKDVWEITATDGSTEAVSFPNQSVSAGYRTSYTYDGLGNLIGVSQGGTQSRAFAYDNLSRLLSATNPESGTVSYTYDASGNLKTKRDPRNIKTVYDYDELNRVTKRCYRSIGTGPLGMTTCNSNNETDEPNTSDVTYTFENTSVTDLKGVLTKVANESSSSDYIEFDATGRITRSRQTTDGVVYGDDTNPMTYTYSLSGALIEQRYPSGRVVKSTPNNDGLLSLVQSKKNSTSGYWTYGSSFTYNAAGAVTSMQLGNGRWESTTFNSRLQPTQIALGATVGATNILDLDYAYGTTANNGNVLSQTITVPSVGQTNGFTAVQTYSYDSLNRLKDATENITPYGGSASQSWKQTFVFDRYGNRNFDEANTSFEGFDKLCNSNSELCFDLRKKLNPSINTSDNRFSSGQGYGYDPSGNTTDDPYGREFIYDAENKQVKVLDDQDATIGEYFYDGDGKRVKKYIPAVGENPGETTVFVYDAAGNLIGEYSTTVAPSNDAKVAYLTNDHLGSPRVNTGANGEITSRHDYHPFGEEIITPQRTADLGYGVDSVRRQFTGYERDNETDFDYAQARFYANRIGRFNTPDQPFADQHEDDPQSWNLYIYVGNNPLNFTDPSGLWKKVDCSSGQCWEAEEGDTFTSLAQLVDIPVKFLSQFFGDVNPSNIAIGQTFDLGGFEHWDITSSFASMGIDVQTYAGDKPFDRNDPNLAQDIPRILQPDKPTGHPIVDGAPTLVEGVEDGLDTILIILSLRRGGGGKVPTVKNLRLSNIVRDLFKGALTKRPIGTGSTADAVRYELRTGKPVGGKFHSEKARQYAQALEKWLTKNPTASPQDRKVAQTLLSDLKNALSGK